MGTRRKEGKGKVLEVGGMMQCIGVQEWKITGFGKGVL